MRTPVAAADLLRYKQLAAERAVDLVESGMVVGLGTGSTAIFAVRRIAARLRDGSLRDIVGVPTSVATEAEARTLGIPLAGERLPSAVDITIDGADEVDPQLRLIKGGGGALLREKIVATVSRREVIVVDETKLSPALGTRYPLPIEVLPFGWEWHARFIESLGARVTVRRAPDGTLCRSDQGNYIVDAAFGPISSAESLAAALATHAGIVEHGLFLGLTSECLVGGARGIERLLPSGDARGAG